VKELWSYEKLKRLDANGKRWHFMSHDVWLPDIPYEEQPFELYFRNDAKTVYGLLKFERRKDNPYRDYDLIVRNIMDDKRFREGLLNPDTKVVW
jgi:hypothetical protein